MRFYKFQFIGLKMKLTKVEGLDKSASYSRAKGIPALVESRICKFYSTVSNDIKILIVTHPLWYLF